MVAWWMFNHIFLWLAIFLPGVFGAVVGRLSLESKVPSSMWTGSPYGTYVWGAEQEFLPTGLCLSNTFHPREGYVENQCVLRPWPGACLGNLDFVCRKGRCSPCPHNSSALGIVIHYVSLFPLERESTLSVPEHCPGADWDLWSSLF